ncbi:hypothetical protein [Nonomuraea sp. NPDC049141]|uniref:SbtR family transcriptional regulator n=1 Tax=Nonomuraea sp. NPDC049141 TaxID=3155500 RepID=UPI0033C4D8EE
MLEAVFRERIETLCAHAFDLAGGTDSRAALLEWLSAVTADVATIRGLAIALTREASPDSAHEHCCTAQLAEAGDPLVRRAAHDGALTPGVTIADLLTLITGIALATEHHPDPAAEAGRLLGLATAGVGPHRG